jgi:hypothetical protein
VARCSEGRAEGYRRREPEGTVLYQVLAEHLETLLDRTARDRERPGLPGFVELELRRFFACGILAHGFSRVHCPTCGRDLLVAFSCKGCGFCPSCGGRRMADTAAWLVDRVLPDVEVRQWVPTFPWSLRFQLAREPSLCRAVRRTFLRAVFAFHARRAGLAGARTGVVNVVQHFASALHLDIHFHALVLDCVYTCESPWTDPVFHPFAPPTDEDVARLCRTIRDRVLRLLERRGLLEGDAGKGADVEPPLLDALAAASIAGRVALGERAGRTLARIGAHPGREVSFVPGELCAQIDGFSLHARVRVPRGDRNRLERLCRYVARPAIATERLSLSRHGNELYRFRRPWRDGSTHVVFEPLVFRERLAALVPRPRAHLVRDHGVLAPSATWRDRIVPGPRPPTLGPRQFHQSPSPLGRAPEASVRRRFSAMRRWWAARDDRHDHGR